MDYNVGYEVNHNTAHEEVRGDVDNPTYDEIETHSTDNEEDSTMSFDVANGEDWQDIAVARNSAYEDIY